MNKKILFLIIFGIVMFSLRLFNLHEALYDDESNFAYSLTVMDKFGFNEEFSSPQPLNILYKPLIALFGLETWVFRLIPWLFGIINTLLVYFLAQRNYGEKAAFWATFLMLISFYPTLASLQFDVEGNLVMFSVLLFFFSYLEYEKAEKKSTQLSWQIVSGLGLGLAITCKYNAIYLVLIVGLYSLMKSKWDVKQSCNDLFIVYIVGFLLFLSEIMLGILASPQHWLNFIPIISWKTGFAEDYRSTYFSFLGLTMYLLWSTPLLFGSYSIAVCKRAKDHLLLVLWITIPILFYTFIITYGSMDRYFMSTIPALVLLGGICISKMNFNKNQIFFGSIFLFFCTFIFFVLNSLPLKYIARLPQLYIAELKRLNFNFLFTYTSASGPTFGINFLTIFLAVIIAAVCIFSYLILKNKKIAHAFLMVFFVTGVSFNLFLVSEYLLHPTSPNISGVKFDMIQYVKENNLSFPLYTNDEGIQWYFDHQYKNKNGLTIGFSDNEVGDRPSLATDNILSKGGTIILVRWPPLPEGSPADEVTSLCTLHKPFYSKGILIGEVYRCENHRE